MRLSLALGCAVAAALAVGVSTPVGAQPSSRWALGPQPAVTLGMDESEPDAVLQVIVFATQLANGSIIVGDRGEFALKFFDKSGRFLRAFARKGSGPGEVRYLGRMFRCGDSLYTYDIEEGYRMSVFGLDGRYTRAFRWQAPIGQTVPYVSACNPSGEFIHVGWPALTAARSGIHRARVPVWMSRGDAGAPRMLDSVAGSERWGIMANGQFVGSRPLPLGKQPVVAIGRARALVGSADRFMVSAFEFNGRPLQAIERSLAPSVVSTSDIRAEVQLAVANAGEAHRARVEAGYAEITFPTTLPAYTHLLVDSEDHLWVRPFPRGSGGTVLWSVFAPSGVFAGEVAVPVHLEVFEIGRDYVLGRFMDPKEAIPQVRLYRLTRAAAGSDQ